MSFDITRYTNYAFNIARRNDYRYFLLTNDEETKKKSIDFVMSFFQFCRVNSLTSLPLSEKFLNEYVNQCLTDFNSSISNFCFHILVIKSIYERYKLKVPNKSCSLIKKSLSDLNRQKTKKICNSVLENPCNTIEELRDKCILTWALNESENPLDKYLVGSIFKSQVEILKEGDILIQKYQEDRELLIKQSNDVKLCPVKIYLEYEKFAPENFPLFNQTTNEVKSINLNFCTKAPITPRQVESIFDKWLGEDLALDLDFLHLKIDEELGVEDLPYYHKISRELSLQTYDFLRRINPLSLHFSEY